MRDMLLMVYPLFILCYLIIEIELFKKCFII